jgi:hypothetical protein
MEYKKLNLGSIVKLAVDSKGITNGSIDIFSFEYDVNSDIEKIVDYVETNNFVELKDEVVVLKDKNLELENSIKNFALEIVALGNDTELLKFKIEQYNTEIKLQYNNLTEISTNILSKIITYTEQTDLNLKNKYDTLILTLKEIRNRIDPKIIEIVKEKIVKEVEYIERRTTFYKGVKTIDEVKKEEEEIRSKRRPQGISGWFDYSDEWMVYLSFDKQTFFMTKTNYQNAINRGLPPGGIGPLYPSKLFHQLYDK